MPTLTRAQSREVDRIAMEDLRIPGIVLMENAARGIAEAIFEVFPGSGTVSIVCGPGNNGGDGFALARHLSNAGQDVHVHLASPEAAYREDSDAAINLAIVRAMDLPVLPHADLDDERIRLVVDAVFGTGLDREVNEPYRSVVHAINASGKPVVAVDIPSGLDADTGEVHGAAVIADLTVTMVAPKIGFARCEGPDHVGDVIAVDIGAPPEAIAEAISNA